MWFQRWSSFWQEYKRKNKPLSVWFRKFLCKAIVLSLFTLIIFKENIREDGDRASVTASCRISHLLLMIFSFLFLNIFWHQVYKDQSLNQYCDLLLPYVNLMLKDKVNHTCTESKNIPKLAISSNLLNCTLKRKE